ncbi:hypothetical protein HPB47_014789, partial [Ixodes persulcatus]
RQARISSQLGRRRSGAGLGPAAAPHFIGSYLSAAGAAAHENARLRPQVRLSDAVASRSSTGNFGAVPSALGARFGSAAAFAQLYRDIRRKFGVFAGSADVDSAIQKASSVDGKVGRGDPSGTTGKPVASNDTGPVPTAKNQSLAAANGSNGTGAATPSPPSRGPGDAVLHFGEDAVDRTPKIQPGRRTMANHAPVAVRSLGCLFASEAAGPEERITTRIPYWLNRGSVIGSWRTDPGKTNEVNDPAKSAALRRDNGFPDDPSLQEDNYLMSILIPIACGMSAALLILCSLACIGCCRRRCRARSRRKLHRNIDPNGLDGSGMEQSRTLGEFGQFMISPP